MAKCLTKLLSKRPSSRLPELYITIEPHTFRRYLMRSVLGVGVSQYVLRNFVRIFILLQLSIRMYVA